MRPFVSCLQMCDLSKQHVCIYNEEFISILSDNMQYTVSYKIQGIFSQIKNSVIGIPAI